MGYATSTLGTKERVLYQGVRHWLYWLAAYLLAAPAFAIALGGYPYGPLDYALGAAALAILPFGLVLLIRAYATEIVVTSDRFILKSGLVSYHADEVGLDTIEEVDIDESVLGRLLDYGTLQIHGTGNAKIRVAFVWDPERLRRAIQNARSSVVRPARALAEAA
jgi:uncharacterized membrane protein YdbT with pleckstrin-like domain